MGHARHSISRVKGEGRRLARLRILGLCEIPFVIIVSTMGLKPSPSGETFRFLACGVRLTLAKVTMQM